ncbi:MAG TPA: hypothetical protein ENI23_17605 [bacterium]|nr:hypothetical protein [bacterium]
MKQKLKYILILLGVIVISSTATYFVVTWRTKYVLLSDSEVIKGARTTYEKLVRQTEPLLLTGTDVLLIEDTEYVLTSSIVVEDDAKVIIKNSKFVQDVTHSSENHIQFYGDSSMEITDSVIDVNQWATWGFYGYSTLTQTNVSQSNVNLWLNLFDHAEGIFKEAIYRGTIGGDVKLSIDDGKKRSHIEMTFPVGAIVDESFVPTLKEFHFPNENDKHIQFQLDIINSGTIDWSFGANPDSDITIRDAKSINMTFALGIPGMEAEFTDLKTRHYDDETWEFGDGTVRLINTGVELWSPVAGQGNTLIIRSSSLSDIQYSTHDAKIYIYDSVIDLLVALEDVEVVVENSRITGDVKAQENGRIELINTKVRGEIIEEGNGRVIVK